MNFKAILRFLFGSCMERKERKMIDRWDDRATHRVQTNNSVEAILRKSGVASWLENCGPTSATVGCETTGHAVDVTLPGGATIQPEDALSIWMNDPENVSLLKAVDPSIDPTAYFDNELIGYYPLALQKVFGAIATVSWKTTWDQIIANLRRGAKVMIHLKKPRHYLCCVHFDEATQAIVYRDPWPGRTGTDGYNLSMKQDEFLANVQDSIVIIEPAV